jgi:hypothetical protein
LRTLQVTFTLAISNRGARELIKRVLFCRCASFAGRLALNIGIATALSIGPSVAAQDQSTGTLVPGGGGSSMVQESGRLRPSDRAQTNGRAAMLRAANEAHETLRRFGSCLVSGAGTSREQKDLAAFLRTLPEDPALTARAKKILRENCLYGTGAESALLRFSPSLLRGAIFRQLYLDHGRKLPAPVTPDDISSAWSHDGSGSFAASQRFGNCIVAADQQAAENFVRAKVASVEQDASLRAVMMRMSGCLTQGLTLQMSRVVLDGVLAEALYRRITASGTLEGPDRGRVAHKQ